MKIGIIGFGFMGTTHLSAWRKVEGAVVTAICERNPENIQPKKGNIASASTELDLHGVSVYSQLEQMLTEADLDAVSITLPTHLHKDVSIKCLQAGLHVICEKPMALNLEDCQAMTEAAHEANKELMIAHCIRFWPAYAWLKETLEAKRYGKLQAAEFERLSCAPTWGDDSWFTDNSKSGGIALDLHIHDLDFIQYLLGRPNASQSTTVALENGTVGHVQTSLKYDNKTVSATASWMMPKSFGFKMAYKAVFENAAAIYDGESLQVYTQESEPIEPKLPNGDGYQHEIAYFADRISGRTHKDIIPPEQAAESVRMALETT